MSTNARKSLSPQTLNESGSQHSNQDSNGHAATPSHSSNSSQANPAFSPPNQPRRSLSTQLAPDYHGWVNDVSTSLKSPSRPPSSTSRFLDAVTSRSKSQQGRSRRENQPSFSGSTFTNSDNEADKNEDSGGEFEGDTTNRLQQERNQISSSTNSEHVQSVSQQDSLIDQRAPNSEPVTKLPRLSKSRVQVPDPSRPTFKLGAPIISKPRAQKSHLPNVADTEELDSQPTETSALLGNNNRPRDPQGNDNERWTNEGSRRRTPRYNGSDQQTDAGRYNQDLDIPNNGDSLRWPSRARSLSPTMEARRGGRIVFRNYPTPSSDSRRSRNKTFNNFRRSSIANINMVRDKFLPRRRSYYDDAKEALVKENNGIRIWYHNYTTIDWIHDFVKERVRLRHLRSLGGIRGLLKNKADSLKGWVLVLLTAGGWVICEWVTAPRASGGVNIFVVGIQGVTLFAGICVVMVTSDGTVSQQRSHGSTKRRSVPNTVGIASSDSRNSVHSILNASQPKKIAYFGAGSGIPEVKTILGGFVIRGFLGFRTLMIKLIGLPLMVASGLNMGKQGPLVHIACCVGNIVCRIFDKYNRNDGKRREILSAAAASGVAVAFGAPIGGVLFSLEEVSYYFPSKTMWRTYFCALVSAVVLKMINPYRVGKTVLFQVTYDRDWHLFEAIPFFFISVFGGVYGALFSQFHMNYSRLRSRTWIGRHPVQEVLIVTVITCAIQWLNPWTRVNLLQLLTNLYSECTSDNDLNGMCAVEIDQIYPIFLLLAQVFAMKVILNFVTFGVKVPGGIFIPTMVAGAVFGRMVGLGVQWLIATYPEYSIFQVCEGDSMDCVIPGLYAMIGAAACLSGVTRMTVSLVVIMFELTGAMTYSLPIMMAVMIGKFVGDAFSPDAFFNKLIDLNEHPYLDNKKDYNTFGTAADIADRYLETIDVNEQNDVGSLRRKVEILAVSGYSDGGLPIVDRGILVGYIASNELAHALDLAEEKDPECICVFRNRASSNVPATEIITLLSDIEAQAEARNRNQYSSQGLTASPTRQDFPQFNSQTDSEIQDSRQEWSRNRSREEINYDNDMQGYDRPIREPDLLSRLRRQSGNVDSRRNSKGSIGDLPDYEGSCVNGENDSVYPHGSGRYDYRNSRADSTGTSNLLRDPAHTMDFTPFTDQAPLAVSLFSSMDLVMELFIKLGIKYVCVVKAGEHYGMIHKKRLLSFLKENDEKQKRHNQRTGCC
ncbi:hypothetical protein BGZ46_009619 [Entomortierella lignicola]|nr:hypothetical protein BGZ46_009619 [Entomortierella lignicola]